MRLFRRKPGRSRASIARRMGTAIAVVIFVLLADLASTVWGVLQLSDLNQRIQQQDLPLGTDSSDLLVALVNEETGLRGYLLTNDPAFKVPLDAGRSSYTRLVSDLGPLTAKAGLSAQLTNLVSQVDAWQTQYVIPALAEHGGVPARQGAADATRGRVLFDHIRAAQSRLETAVDTATRNHFAEASTIRTRIMVGVVFCALFGVVLGVTLLLLALRATLRPLASLRDIARAMNEGRPLNTHPPSAPPELAEVHKAIVAAGSALQEREIALARANEELGDASRLKSEFLSTMSHELRTPLNAILGFTDLVRSGATGGISAQTDDYLERVRRNGAILLELINDVLDLSKIEAGRVTVSHDVVAVVPVVREVMGNVQSLAAAKGIAFELHADGDDSCLAIADRRATKQILTNLIGNAVKFTEDGSVSVKARVLGDATLVEVTDTGPGIVPDDQMAVFEPFRQVGTHARTGTGGTGLGLAIASRLAHLMGGDITLSSQLGEGSRFTLRLPTVQGYPRTPLKGDGPVILAVDDDLDALSLMQAQCERMGFSFVGVQQSATAITAAATLDPAAILLDIVFPEDNGWQILARLRAEPRTTHIPVHVISVTDAAETASDAGVSFIQKPVTEERLRVELEPYLRSPLGAGV